MSRARRGSFIALAIAAALPACTPDDLPKQSFVGTWTIVDENGLTGHRDEERATVSAQHEKFRLAITKPTGEELIAYDGHALHERYTSSTPSSLETSAEPSKDIGRPATETDVQSLRFWTDRFPGHEVGGGQICGRETVLLELKEHRPDGDFSLQQWSDGKTGIVLKFIQTVYSSQVQSMVTKKTRECQSLEYRSLDPTTFSQL